VRSNTWTIWLIGFSLLAAAGLLPEEFSYYRKLLRLPDETGLRAVAMAGLLGKTLAGLTPGLAIALWQLRRRRVVAGIVVGTAWTVAVALYLFADLRVRAATGNPLASYAAYLGEPDPFVWAGGWPTVLRSALCEAAVGLGALGALAALAGLGAWIASRTRARASRVLRVLTLVWLIGLVLPPAVQRLAPFPFLLFELSQSQPWAWHWGLPSSPERLRPLRAEAEAVYRTYGDALHRGRPLPETLLSSRPPRRPDVFLIVVESFRHDALRPDVMPAVWRFAELGTRFSRHYAGSNASHYGLFQLLHGRSGLAYHDTLDRELPPALPQLLGIWGYRNWYLTGGEVEWLDMERFLGPPWFETRFLQEGGLPARDARALREVAGLRRQSEGGTFALAFLMSTHFPYHFPPEGAVFRPFARRVAALDPALASQRVALKNRYDNAARHLDSLLGSWLESIDPTRDIVILTGDHGESLFDDGTLAHASRLSEIQTRVPFVLVGPGVPRGQVVDRPTTHLDVLPTLLRLLGAPRSGFAGRDLLEEPPRALRYAPLVDAKGSPSSRDLLALVGEELRFGLRLRRDRREVQLVGKLDERGLPSGETLRAGEGRRVLRWLADHAERSASARPRIR